MKSMKTKIPSKIIKIIMIIVAVLSINSFFANPVSAKEVTIDSILNTGKTWISQGEKDAKDYGTTDQFVNDLLPLGQILVAIGIGALTIVSIVMAIQWIIATPDKQAQLKKQLVGLVIATFVIFGAVGIWELIQTLVNQSGLV